MIELTGQIERITFTSEDTGYTIAKLRVQGHWDLVTIVGNIMAPSPGEILKLRGEWVRHPKYGDQFKVNTYQTTVPATIYGIEKYLGSGLIKGLGPKMAGRIVKKFGEKTLDIIDHQPHRLAEIDGIGAKRITMIQHAWKAQKKIRDVMIFLRSHGVSTGYATKIFKTYQERSIAVVKQNPYRLALDIFGFGFVIADGIANKLGFPKDSELRAEAGVIYVLQHLSDDGHVFYPYALLIKKCMEILDVKADTIQTALQKLSREQRIVIDELGEDIRAFMQDDKAVYLKKFHICETGIAMKMKALMHTPSFIPHIDTDKAIAWAQRRLAIDFAKNQLSAIKDAIEKKVTIITGGPGTGKTTIINAIVKIFLKRGLKIMLAAPTGRAAKRLKETAGHDAKTIHRLLEFSMQKGGFLKKEDNPLDCDILIIDEASMIDTILMHYLLKAVPLHTTFVLVGDVDQLPSVGPGHILDDMIQSRQIPLISLNEIFRQARKSRIVTNAHRINNGQFPAIDPPSDSFDKTDFYFIDQENPERALNTILELVTKRIPDRFKFDAVNDIQVLTPMHKGIVGATNLNSVLQNAINKREEIITKGSHGFRINDKVMQIKNNYDKLVFNGDIGRIETIDTANQHVVISFDGRLIPYEYSELNEIVLAYAISIHKSQGSEYPAVVIPILTQHFVLLQRNLIYTAVTRGKNLVVLVGSKKALTIGIKNNKTQKRFTYLKHRLKN